MKGEAAVQTQLVVEKESKFLVQLVAYTKSPYFIIVKCELYSMRTKNVLRDKLFGSSNPTLVKL